MKEEAENQTISYEFVDSRIVCIPRMYDLLSDERGWGYVVTELIDGKVICLLEGSCVIQKRLRACLIISQRYGAAFLASRWMALSWASLL